MSISRKRFYSLFTVHDLEFDKWNNIDGLEVMPVYSPHPVEDSMLLFRAFWEGGYKTYAHLADIPSNAVLEKVLGSRVRESEAAARLYLQYKSCRDMKADCKKIDIGGGMIHGDAMDFKDDGSGKLLFSHTARDLTRDEREIGSNATFGQEDTLIETNKNYYLQSAYRYLAQFFPSAAAHDLDMLLNCPEVHIPVGEIIIRKGVFNKHIYLILGGVAEVIDSEKGVNHRLTAGSFIGELFAMAGNAAPKTYRAISHLTVLRIPLEIYDTFVKKNMKPEVLKWTHQVMSFLQGTALFGEMISGTFYHQIARKATTRAVEEKAELLPETEEEPQIVLLVSGKAQIYSDNRYVDFLVPGDFYGEEFFLLGTNQLFRAVAQHPTKLLVIPVSVLKSIPIIEWKLMESFEKRLQALGTQPGK